MRFRLRSVASQLTWPWGPAHAYQQTLAAMNRLAHAQTRLLQSGYLRYYLLTIVLTTTGLLGITLVSRGGLSWSAIVLDGRFYEIGLAVLILLAAGAAIVSRSRLGAVAALGMAGYGVALMYLLFGAPDLAMTSFLIESLTVILFVLVFYHLPRFAQLTSRHTRARDAIIALLAGGLITTLVLLAVGIQLHPSIAGYFAAKALPLAHGRNIVNLILVDFRALDTLGEITVLGIAAVGVYALLKLRKDSPP
jgi:multicomponent Na+:H+ antiporter subunit A